LPQPPGRVAQAGIRRGVYSGRSMKRARFMHEGRLVEGVLKEPGVLEDAAGRAYPDDGVRFLPPVEPTKVVALALNYADHAAEFELAVPEEPALFFKSPNTWVGHRQPVIYPAGGRYVHYEVELAVVVGTRCRRVSAARAMDMVGGYTIANDLVIRDYVANTFRPPLRGKCWDTFCPIGPYLVVDEVEDANALGLRAYVNGELRQTGTTADMIRKIPELIEYVAFFMTLEPNDLILTGTPRGVSHVYPGDVMRLEVDGLGALENPIIPEEA
jgi:5-oxopent-3-ene-1,2,5-tricarboxylate decarboxylase/2-hydroxyhepta-2,4-diene-1,7-dioate isomerase